jgi:hypothetical protein
MKRYLYIIFILLSGSSATFFLYGTIHTVLNHYFYFAPNKIAVEFESSMIFAGAYFVIFIMSLMVVFFLNRKFKQLKTYS